MDSFDVIARVCVYQLLPFTGCPQGGGAAPHDIHHYKPTCNFGFIFVTWDRLFGTYEAVREKHPCNPHDPSLTLSLQRRRNAAAAGAGVAR